MSQENRARISISSLNELFRRRVWDAKVPINIKISENDLRLLRNSPLVNFQNVKSRQFFALATRTSYFPLLLPQLRRHYDDVFTAMSSLSETCTPWLEYGGKPLSWHYPIGHLFDECHRWLDCSLPWVLILHFTDYPTELFPPDDSHVEEGGGAIGMHFYSMLKQSDYIRYGSSKNVMNLSKTEQTQLWDGLWTHSFGKFWSVYPKILGSEDAPNTWKGVPLRLYINEESNRCIFQGNVNLQRCHTLGDAMNCILPDYPGDFRLVTHGIIVDLDTPISWLALYFIYPDGFLHLIVCT